MERRSPAVCKVSDHTEGKDEMTKASIDLQDLRRRIYVKAKADVSGSSGDCTSCASPEPTGLRLGAVERGWLTNSEAVQWLPSGSTSAESRSIG